MNARRIRYLGGEAVVRAPALGGVQAECATTGRYRRLELRPVVDGPVGDDVPAPNLAPGANCTPTYRRWTFLPNSVSYRQRDPANHSRANGPDRPAGGSRI
jgi:hypothetical protein